MLWWLEPYPVAASTSLGFTLPRCTRRSVLVLALAIGFLLCIPCTGIGSVRRCTADRSHSLLARLLASIVEFSPLSLPFDSVFPASEFLLYGYHQNTERLPVPLCRVSLVAPHCRPKSLTDAHGLTRAVNAAWPHQFSLSIRLPCSGSFFTPNESVLFLSGAPPALKRQSGILNSNSTKTRRWQLFVATVRVVRHLGPFWTGSTSDALETTLFCSSSHPHRGTGPHFVIVWPILRAVRQKSVPSRKEFHRFVALVRSACSVESPSSTSLLHFFRDAVPRDSGKCIPLSLAEQYSSYFSVRKNFRHWYGCVWFCCRWG